MFYPIEQTPPRSVTFIAKVRGNPDQYLAICRDAVQRTDRNVPVYDVRTLDERLADTLARPRFYTTAILFFAGFALLLAVIGTYGVASHCIAQRTHEIGVRIAVGASPLCLRGMLLRQGMLPVFVGMVGGVSGAAVLGRFLQHLIPSAEPTGLWICATAASVLAATTAGAVWTATDRIVRMDPTAALKAE
jgi:ABC-type antimicrobial peptide transport system permease subunit